MSDVVTLAEAQAAAQRLRQALWRAYQIDPAACDAKAIIEKNGEVCLRVGIDSNSRAQPPDQMGDFEGYRVVVGPFDGAPGVQRSGNVPHRSMFE